MTARKLAIHAMATTNDAGIGAGSGQPSAPAQAAGSGDGPTRSPPRPRERNLSGASGEQAHQESAPGTGGEGSAATTSAGRRPVQTPQPGSTTARRLVDASQNEMGHADAVHVLERESSRLSRVQSFHETRRAGRSAHPGGKYGVHDRPPGAPRRQFETNSAGGAGISGIEDPDAVLRMLKGPPGTAEMFQDVRRKAALVVQHARVLANIRAARG